MITGTYNTIRPELWKWRLPSGINFKFGDDSAEPLLLRMVFRADGKEYNPISWDIWESSDGDLNTTKLEVDEADEAGEAEPVVISGGIYRVDFNFDAEVLYHRSVEQIITIKSEKEGATKLVTSRKLTRTRTTGNCIA